MARKLALAFVCICLPLAPGGVWACAGHLYLNPDKLGFIGGTVARMTGLAPPKPVFELDHPAMAKTVVGEDSEIILNYSRPFFSKNVRLELSGSKNVRLSQDVILLEEREGTVSIPYQVLDSGFDSITLTVIGQHRGETVRQQDRIYVSGRKAAPEQPAQVSQR